MIGGQRAKYGAVPTDIDGIRFASKKEARRYLDLSVLMRAGAIKELELQPRYRIMVCDVFICDYFADFQYVDLVTGEFVVEDVKGMKTDVYKLKKRLVEASYPVSIREV